MALSDKKFSHITVSTDEEDDFVIEAGVRAGASRVAGKRDEQPIAADDDATTSETDAALEENAAEAGDAEDDAAEDATEPEPEPEASAAASVPAAKKPQARKDAKSAYQSTTMEDLEGTPMSTTQKVVIGLALVLIVAAVIYYFVALR